MVQHEGAVDHVWRFAWDLECDHAASWDQQFTPLSRPPTGVTPLHLSECMFSQSASSSWHHSGIAWCIMLHVGVIILAVVVGWVLKLGWTETVPEDNPRHADASSAFLHRLLE